MEFIGAPVNSLLFSNLGFSADRLIKVGIFVAQGKVLPREKFYPKKKSTPEEVYHGKNPQFLSNLYETW